MGIVRQNTPFQTKLIDAASALIKTTLLGKLAWKPDPGPIGFSHSESNHVHIVHARGRSEIGHLTVYVWFDDVDEERETFRICPQVMFAGRTDASVDQEVPGAQIFFGKLGFTYPF